MSADDARKLFVGGLSDAVGEAELRAFFEGGGFAIEHVAIPRDRETGKVRGFGFVTLSSATEVSSALLKLNGGLCGGRSLSIRPFSQEPPKRGTERPARGPEPSLFLGKLPYDATEAEIAQLFESNGVGPVVRVTLPAGPDGRPRGFGFVTLASDEAADKAIEKLDGAAVRGRPIVVSKAQPKGARPPGGPGGPPRGDGPRMDGGGPPRSDFPPRGGGGGGRPGGFSDDRFGGGGGGGGGYSPSYPPPSADADGRRRRADAKKPEKKVEKKKGVSTRDGSKGERGGGGNWHRWEEDD